MATGDRGAVAYPPEAVLKVISLAEWLAISERTAEQLPIKSFYVGNRRVPRNLPRRPAGTAVASAQLDAIDRPPPRERA